MSRWKPSSIAFKLPLGAGALLLLVTVTMAVFAFLEVQRLSIRVASERLTQVSGQFRDLLETSARQQRAAMVALAALPDLPAFATHAAAEPIPAELEQRLRAHVRTSAQIRSVELWDSAGNVVYRAGTAMAPMDGPTRSELVRHAALTDSGVTGPYRHAADSVDFTTLARIRRPSTTGAGSLAGFVVERRRLVGTPQAVQQVSDLIGRGSRLLVGNVGGDVWTNLAGPAEGPPGRLHLDTVLTRYRRSDGMRAFLRSLPVPGTPWVVAIEFLEAPVLSSAKDFLAWALVAALLLSVLGAGLGAALSRSITRPLAHVSDAAASLAAGNESTRVPVIRRDEIGQLATSFNTMAAQIEQGRERLRSTLRQYRLLFERNPLPMWVCDPETGAFLEVNHAAADHYGYSRDDFLARTIHEVRLDGDRPRALGEEAENETTGRWIRKHRTRDGSVIDVDVAWSRHERDGRSVSLAVVNDITTRLAAERQLAESNAALRKSQEQLLQAQKMEALGRLAGGVAHDYNNITTAILGFAEFVVESLPEDDTRREDLEQIRQAALRAADLTKQLLAFSRQQIVEVQPVPLNQVVADAGRLLQRLVGEDIALVTSLGPMVGLIESDPGQVTQALVNLVVNASDAIPLGGKITIETTIVELGAAYLAEHAGTRPGRYVLLAVSDTGTGMTPDITARVFEPFFTTKPRGQGTGLGLAMVYGLVRQSGGHVAVYSEPGKGSVFKLYFPELSPSDQPATVEVAPAVPARRGHGTILLVEDNPGVRAIAQRALAQHGYHVITATGSADALALVGKSSDDIALVITDVVMPEMSGPELAEQLRERLPAARVLFISGYTDDAIVRHGLVPSLSAYLQKPFTPQQLVDKVREVLGGKG